MKTLSWAFPPLTVAAAYRFAVISFRAVFRQFRTSAALLLVKFRFWVQLWIFASRLRLFAFLIHDLILPEAVTPCQ